MMELLQLVITTLTLVLLANSAAVARHRRHGHSGGWTGEPEVCVMPPAAELERKLSFPMDLHGTFFQFPPLRDSVMTLDRFLKENANMTNRQYSYINADHVECKPKVEQNTPAWDPCPVVWKFNHDENRKPETIVEAECLQCQLCRDMDTDDGFIGCGPVHYFTKVLRRKRHCNPVTGHYDYVVVWEPVSVGCACRGGVRTRPTASLGGVIRTPYQK